MKDDKHHIAQQKLQKLLRQMADELYEETVRTGGKVDASQLEDLERMERLIKARAATSNPKRNIKWLFVFLFIGTLAIVSILLFARVSKTDIELKVLVSETRFRLQKRQFLTNLMRLSSLGVAGLKGLSLPRSENKNAREIFSTDDSGLSVQLSEVDSTQQKGTLTVGAIALPANSFVWLRANVNSRQFGMTIRDTELNIRTNVNGNILLNTSTASSEHLNFLSPKEIGLKSGNGDIDLDFKLANANDNNFSRQLLVDSISFISIEEHNEDEHSIVRNLSTILSGTMFLESLGGQQYQFRTGEEIRFGSSKGEISTIGLKENHIAITFRGTVSGITTGSDSNQKSLMPTYLNWLKERHGFTLLWGSTLYIFSLIFTIFKWWRTPL